MSKYRRYGTVIHFVTYIIAVAISLPLGMFIVTSLKERAMWPLPPEALRVSILFLAIPQVLGLWIVIKNGKVENRKQFVSFFLAGVFSLTFALLLMFLLVIS